MLVVQVRIECPCCLSEVHNYVGITYRETIDTKDWVTDVHAQLVTFGHDSQHPIAPKNIPCTSSQWIQY